MLKNKWTIFWIVTLLIVFGLVLKTFLFPNPEAKKTIAKLEQFRTAAEEKNNQVKNEMNQYVDNVRCYGNGACFYLIILSFRQTPHNLEEIMKKYTKEYAQLKFEMSGRKEKSDTGPSLLAKTSDKTGLLCKADVATTDEFIINCTNVNPEEYDK